MFLVQISFLIVTFLSFISQFLSVMQTTKEVNPHPRIASCVNMWSVILLLFFFFLCHFLSVGACIYHIAQKAKWSGPHQWRWRENEFKFHSVTCYTKSIVSRIHVNTTKLRNITCTLVATCVILPTLECKNKPKHRWMALLYISTEWMLHSKEASHLKHYTGCRFHNYLMVVCNSFCAICI